MEITEKTSTINDLLTINNERYEGYKTAAEKVKDTDLKNAFSKFSSQSKRFSDELKPFVTGKEIKPRTTESYSSEKKLRALNDLKRAVSNNNRKAAILSCSDEEDVALEIYDKVIQKPESIPQEALNIIKKHKKELQETKETVKSLNRGTNKSSYESVNENERLSGE